MPPERSNPPAVGPNLPQDGRRSGQISHESPDLPLRAIRKGLDERISLVIPSGIQETAGRPGGPTTATATAKGRSFNEGNRKPYYRYGVDDNIR
jgi:hypothetical protein